MTKGPWQTQLDLRADTPVREHLGKGAQEWADSGELLERVAGKLRVAAGKSFEGKTGEALDKALRATAGDMERRAEVLRKGGEALSVADLTVSTADTDRMTMDADHPQPTDPGAAPTPQGPGQPSKQDLRKAAEHDQAVADYWDTYHRRERIARQAVEAFDAAYEASTATMKEIHGEPDPRPPGPGDGSSGTSTPSAPSTAPRTPPGAPPPTEVPPPHTNQPPPGQVPPDEIPTGTTLPVTPVGPGTELPIGSTDAPISGTGGVGAGTLGGLAVGGLGAGALARLSGGPLAPGTGPTGAVRPIGATTRTGTTGALGRPGAPGTGAPVTRSGAAGAGRGAASPGTARGAGGRAVPGPSTRNGSGSGTRAAARRPGAAGAPGTGRARRKDEDEERTPRDPFDTEQDWVDDEGAAPGVLD
jgi:hypothetical protein